MSTLDLIAGIIKNSRALVYKDENGQRLFLLTQEWDGGYTLPGGCKDLEDTDMISAMKREMKEELHLDTVDYEIRDTNIEKTYQKLYPDPASERFEKDTRIRLFLVQCKTIQIRPSPDIRSIRWFNEVDVLQSLNKNHMKEMFLLGAKLL